MTKIRFHIGVHKTATTHLQMTLGGCRLAPGTRYVPLKRLRRFLISPVRKGRPRLPWHRWYGGTWLFSDENVLGGSASVRRMYPQPAAALKYFTDCDLQIFMAVRSYETFLPSAWGERLWRHRFEPFEARLPQRRWPHVVTELQAELPGVPIHIWRYEDYQAHPDAIIRFYAADAITEFPPPMAERPKSGFSARAIAHLERHAGSYPGRKRIRQARERFPVGPAYPRFDPWSEEQKTALRAMYAEDIEQLRRCASVWQP